MMARSRSPWVVMSGALRSACACLRVSHLRSAVSPGQQPPDAMRPRSGAQAHVISRWLSSHR